MRMQSEIEQLLRLRVNAHPRGIWLKFEDQRYTWEEVLSLAQRAANGLLRAGIRPGQRVGIMAENKPEFLWFYFATLMIGGVFVPINRWQRGPSLEHMIKDSGVVALAVDEAIEPIILELREHCTSLRTLLTFGATAGMGIDATFAEVMAHADCEPQVEVLEPSSAVGIIYTSGTTGAPKGIVAKHYEPNQLLPLLAQSGVRPGETIYTASPLFHVSGLLVCAMGSIRLDASFALAKSFSASGFWKDTCRYDAVFTNIFSAMFPILLKQEQSPLDEANPIRRVFSVGCPIGQGSTALSVVMDLLRNSQ